MSCYRGFKSLIRTAAQLSVPTARLAGCVCAYSPLSLALTYTVHTHAPSHPRTHAELISAGGAEPGNCIAPSKWKEGPRERKTRERRGGEILKLWFFWIFFPFPWRRLTWQWPGIADGFGRTPLIRVFFNALWTRVGKFYLLILSFCPIIQLVIAIVLHFEWLCVCESESVTEWAHVFMCWYAAEVAGTMSRLFLLSGSTRSLSVCMCALVFVWVCVAAVSGQQLLLSG